MSSPLVGWVLWLVRPYFPPVFATGHKSRNSKLWTKERAALLCRCTRRFQVSRQVCRAIAAGFFGRERRITTTNNSKLKQIFRNVSRSNEGSIQRRADWLVVTAAIETSEKMWNANHPVSAAHLIFLTGRSRSWQLSPQGATTSETIEAEVNITSYIRQWNRPHLLLL